MSEDTAPCFQCSSDFFIESPEAPPTCKAFRTSFLITGGEQKA